MNSPMDDDEVRKAAIVGAALGLALFYIGLFIGMNI